MALACSNEFILGGAAAGADVAKKNLKRQCWGVNKDLLKAIIAAKGTETSYWHK
jgi:hypothetical protein